MIFLGVDETKRKKEYIIFKFGGLAERSIASVLKTEDPHGSWGSNP